jgi:hypothetical protein
LGSAFLSQVSYELNNPLDHGLLTFSSQRWTFPLVVNLTGISICDGSTQVRSAKVNADVIIHERLTLLST